MQVAHYLARYAEVAHLPAALTAQGRLAATLAQDTGIPVNDSACLEAAARWAANLVQRQLLCATCTKSYVVHNRCNI